MYERGASVLQAFHGRVKVETTRKMVGRQSGECVGSEFGN